jgi:hypothetical protein
MNAKGSARELRYNNHMTEDKDQLHAFTVLEKIQMTVCVIAAIVFVVTLISVAL